MRLGDLKKESSKPVWTDEMGDRADRQAVGESVKIRELHSYSSNVEDWDGLLLI